MPHCSPCDRYFVDHHAYEQHMIRSSMHDYCARCERDFSSYNALTSHLANSSQHNLCTLCDIDFHNREDLKQHRTQNHPTCVHCKLLFKNDTGFHEHCRQRHPDLYCVPCRRLFNSVANFTAHMESATHAPKIYACPDRRCKTICVSVSAVIIHLESGKCISGINRAVIDRYVATHDTRNLITKRQLLITDGGMYRGTTSLTATDDTWNGYGYECPLCDVVMRTLGQLNSHLASSKHANGGKKLYHCPQPNCRREFPSLSALGQHVERGGCGMKQNRGLKEAMDSLTNKFSSLTYY